MDWFYTSKILVDYFSTDFSRSRFPSSLNYVIGNFIFLKVELICFHTIKYYYCLHTVKGFQVFLSNTDNFS